MHELKRYKDTTYAQYENVVSKITHQLSRYARDVLDIEINTNEKDFASEKHYNLEHGITPQTVRKSIDEILRQTKVADAKEGMSKFYLEPVEPNIAADPIIKLMSKPQLEKMIADTQKAMQKAAKEMDFMLAAKLRDEMFAYQKMLENH